MTEAHIVVIAGPNGAGKTTFAGTYLRVVQSGLPFLNADLIAAGLDPMTQDPHTEARAGRLMLAGIDQIAAQGNSFAFETTLAGRGYMRRISRWRNDGYQVTLIFLSLPSAEAAVERVRVRVLQGGHNVPEATIRRRYAISERNLQDVYSGLVDRWVRFDTLGDNALLLAGSDTTADDRWANDVGATLAAAAKQAHLRAYWAGTGVVTRRDGTPVVAAPDPAMYADLLPAPFSESRLIDV